MNSKNKSPNQEAGRKISSIKKIRKGCVGLVSIILAGFPVYDYNIVGFRSYIKKEVSDGVNKYSADIDNAIYINCVGETGEKVGESDLLFPRLQSARGFIIDRMNDKGISKHPPRLGDTNVVVCQIDNSTNLCDKLGGAAVGGGKVIIFNSRNVSDHILKHEIAHLGQNINFPFWILEYVADKLSVFSNSTNALYSINDVWGDLLFSSNSDIYKLVYSPNGTLEDLNTLLNQSIISSFLFSDEERNELLQVLMTSSTDQLLKYTIELLEEDSSGELERKLGTSLEGLKFVMESKICGEVYSDGTDDKGVIERFSDYLMLLGGYLVSRFY